MNIDKFRLHLNEAFFYMVKASEYKLKGWNGSYEAAYARVRGHLIQAAAMVEQFKKQKVIRK